MSVFTVEVLFLSRFMVILLDTFFFLSIFYGTIICCLQFFWTKIVTLQIYWSEIPNKCFVCFMSYFTNILKSPLACCMKNSQGRIPSLSFDSSCFKATCNPQSQVVGEVCLQIYFGSDGFRHLWAVTLPVKTTHLGTVIFNFLATPNTSGPTPVSGTGMMPLILFRVEWEQKDHCYPSGGGEGVHVEWPESIF